MRTSVIAAGIVVGCLNGCSEVELRTDPDLPVPNKPREDFLAPGHDFGELDALVIGGSAALQPPLIGGNVDWDEIVTLPPLQASPRSPRIDGHGNADLNDLGVLEPAPFRPRIGHGNLDLNDLDSILQALDICPLLPSTGICADLCDPLALESQLPENVCITVACQLTNGDTILTGGCT